ncbi:MAG: MATE family efflux transporter [Bacteroidetes bacterium]|nr:MATE family efflux transporter [Bacteroidota bacterium]
MKLHSEIIKPLLKLGYPVMIGNLGVILMGLTDNAMVGKLGHVPLAAVGLGNILFFIISVIGIGSLMVFSAFIAGRLEESRTKFARFINSTFVVSLIFVVACFALIQLIVFLFPVFQQEKDVEILAKPYLKILSFSLLPLFLFSSFKNICDGHSRTKPAMFATLSAVGVNVFLNYILIYGKLGFPELGVRGAAWATLMSRIYMMTYMFFAVQGNRRLQYSFTDLKSGFDRSVVKELIKKGFPSGLQFFYEITAFSAAAIFAGQLGSVQLASHQIAMTLAALTYMVANGFSVASMIEAGKVCGDIKLFRRTGESAVVFTSIMMLSFATLFVVLKSPLVLMFNTEPEVLKTAGNLLIIAAVFQLFDGVQVVSLGLLRGAGETKYPTRITLFSYWIIALPLSYLLGKHTVWGIYGIWCGLTLGLIFAAVLLCYRFIKITNEN